MGQSSLFVLAGIALFIRLHPQYPFLAGVALSLCAMKPHLLLPFGVVFIAWAVSRRAYSIVAGVTVALSLELLIACYFDHSILTHYRAMSASDGMASQYQPTLGRALQFAVDPHAVWLEFLPAIFGCAWAVWYFRWNSTSWDWLENGSLVLLVSLGVASYAWISDYVVLLPAIMVAIQRKRSLVLLFALISISTLPLLRSTSIESPIYLWQSVLWLGWYLTPQIHSWLHQKMALQS
jgi:hypothetical protein